MPEPRPAQEALYANHLTQVSRSFAPCIAQLDRPLRHWVGLAYLLCRVLDTVEDAPWTEPAAQQRCFAGAMPLLLAPSAPARVAAWAASLPDGVPPAERNLLADVPKLLAHLHALAPAPRRAMVQTLVRMAEGMRQCAGRRDARGHVRLHGLAEVNRYCYVVAGIVGELLTDLAALAEPAFVLQASTRVDAVHFGLFLQKANLLKDQLRDQEEGRHWLPQRPQVQRSLLGHAHGAARYLLAIPRTAHKFRLFCAWSLFLAMHSLKLYDGRVEAAKIPRHEADALFAELGRLVGDDAALAAAVEEALEGAAATVELAATTKAADPGQAAQTGARAGVPALKEADLMAWLASLGPVRLRYQDVLALGMA